MKKIFKEDLTKLLKEIDVQINDDEINKFYKYMSLLLEWNEKINLTAITEQDEIILKHFVDCITSMKYLNEKESVIDVGTGAGFPGIPLAIMKTQNNFTLVDSLNKRINFLNDVKEKINLKNVQTIHARAEDFGQDKKYRENFDVAVSRAVANLSTLSEYLIPLVKVGGKVICMKGSSIEEEVKDAEYAIKELGGRITSIEKFNLPGTDMGRNIIIIEKVKQTPSKYPRKAGMPAKQPLKNN